MFASTFIDEVGGMISRWHESNEGPLDEKLFGLLIAALRHWYALNAGPAGTVKTVTDRWDGPEKL